MGLKREKLRILVSKQEEKEEKSNQTVLGASLSTHWSHSLVAYTMSSSLEHPSFLHQQPLDDAHSYTTPTSFQLGIMFHACTAKY